MDEVLVKVRRSRSARLDLVSGNEKDDLQSWEQPRNLDDPMSIRIATHCWAHTLPHYADHLRYQLSSLVSYPARTPVAVTVFCASKDRATMDVLDSFEDYQEPKRGFKIQRFLQTPEALGRRSIGRNLASLYPEELIWFTDVDHVFHRNCLNNLWKVWTDLPDPKPTMIYPATVQIHKDHETGDRASERASNASEVLVDINPEEFIPKAYKRAIGGVQIVSGDYARMHGYLPKSEKYQKPSKVPFGDFRDDVAFRGQIKDHGGTVKRVEFEGLYRIRHSTTSYQ